MPQVFTGNTDKETVVTNVLTTPIIARYVQIQPVDWHDHISMRAEFYGCVPSGKVLPGSSEIKTTKTTTKPQTHQTTIK